jgi:tetratricopeptide (TPR) repeat protein
VLAKIAWQHDWDWTHAEETFQRVLARYPNRADLRVHYVSFLCALGRLEEAVDHAHRSLAVDPTSPWCSSMLAQALHMSRRFEEARRQADRTLELVPDFAFARLFSGLSRFCAGDREAGLAHLREGTATGRFDFLAALGCCAGLAGHTDEAHEILEKLESEPAAGPFSLAVACLGCGRIADATRFFDRCVERRDWHVLLVRSDPLFDQYREHELYESLREKIDSRSCGPDEPAE